MIEKIALSTRGFNTKEFCKFYTRPFKKENKDFSKVEKLVSKYKDYFRPFNPGYNYTAYARKDLDTGEITIHLQRPRNYSNLSTYYLVALHELAHLISIQKGWKDEHTYAEEELCAEYTSRLLGKIYNLKDEHSDKYLNYWYKEYIKYSKIPLKVIEKRAKLIAKEIMK